MFVTLNSSPLQDCSLYTIQVNLHSVTLFLWNLIKSYKLHHCKKNCDKLVFSVFTEQLLYQIISRRLHWHKVTLVKRCNKPLLKKSETKIFDQKRFINNLLKVSKEKYFGSFENQSIAVFASNLTANVSLMLAILLTLRKRLQLNC